MPAVANYPQLPKNVWHGVWAILRKTPRRKLDDKALSVELNVQPTAAKAYAREMAKLGLLDDEFNPTDLANKWRQEPNSEELRLQILQASYPQDLIDLAPIGDVDREKIVRWFMNEGLGEGAAKNKAATYIMLSEGVSEDTAQAPAKSAPKPMKASGASEMTKNPSSTARKNDTSKNVQQERSFTPELAVNVQIHISADASHDQIDSIFSSMKKYFSA